MGPAPHQKVPPWFKKWPLGKVKVAPFLEFDQKWPLLRRWSFDSENTRVCGTSKLSDLIKKWPLRSKKWPQSGPSPKPGKTWTWKHWCTSRCCRPCVQVAPSRSDGPKRDRGPQTWAPAPQQTGPLSGKMAPGDTMVALPLAMAFRRAKHSYVRGSSQRTDQTAFVAGFGPFPKHGAADLIWT